MFMVAVLQFASEAKDENHRKQNETDDNVTGVQTDQRIVSRPKQIGAERQPILVDQFMPFKASVDEEAETHGRGDSPPDVKAYHRAFLQVFLR